jgi:hypothetical protein
MNKLLQLSFVVFIIIGCKDRAEIKNDKQKNAVEFENIIGAGYLKLTAIYVECGEWGGHREEIKIYRQKTNLFAEFTKDTISCENHSDLNPRITEKRKINLTSNQVKNVSSYLHDLLDKSLTEQIPYPSPTFGVETIDSSIVIVFRDNSRKWQGFTELKKHLFQ